MEHEHLKPEDPRESAATDEGELDARLLALFRGAEAPGPSSDFASRTLRAVKRERLLPGRRPLRGPLVGVLGWAALIAGVATSAWAIAVSQPLFASVFAGLLGGGISAGVWLMQFAGAGLALSDLFATTGLAVSRVVVTKEGFTGLVVIAALGALSLSALYRLMSDVPERGVSLWQEL
jgi:hypothetical protein